MAFILHTSREEFFAGINVRELGLTKDYTGINFRKRNQPLQIFRGNKFRVYLKEKFSTTLVYDLSKNYYFFTQTNDKITDGLGET